MSGDHNGNDGRDGDNGANAKDPTDTTRPARPSLVMDDAARSRATRDLADKPVEPSDRWSAPAVAEPSRATVGYDQGVRDPALAARTEVDRPAVDPRAVAPTIDSGPVLEGMTQPGVGAQHCPVCGAYAQHLVKCAECGHQFEDPRIGTIVSGRYRVDSLIGAGGFGRVYRGTHLTLGEPVAIKFLLEEFSNRPEQRARFKREAVALAKIRHPSIVAVHDYGEHLGELYMVMELVRGTQLFDRIRDEHGALMPLARVAALVDQVLAVLEVAHALGIVHRDLKPENVMLLETEDRTDHIKVLDFGLALMDDRIGGDRLTATRAVQGTPIYMSPEQCRGRDVGAATDIYAVGVMLFELLSGSAPFEGDSVPDIMAKHMYVEPPTLSEKGADVPAGIEALVASALSKKAEERPTARAFREQLARALRGDDEATKDALQTQQRVENAALTREQRALVEASAEHPRPRDSIAPADGGSMPRAYLCLADASVAEALRGALAVHRVNGVVWKQEGVPSETVLSKRPAKVIVVSGVDSVQRVKELRAAAHTAKTPVMVLDANASTPEYIRAGASDVVAPGSSQEVVCKQIVRLIRRGR
ncbi:MAG: serine/threonine-protein kinase [Polyangiales bacterium]